MTYDKNGYRNNEPSQDELLRRRSQPPPLKAGWLTYTEFLEWAAANGKPARPVGRFEQNPIGRPRIDEPKRNPMGQVEP